MSSNECSPMLSNQIGHAIRVFNVANLLFTNVQIYLDALRNIKPMNWSTFSWKILTTSLYVTPPSTDMIFIFRMFYSNFTLSWERRLTVRSPLGNKAYTDFKTRALRSNRGTSSSTGYASMR